MDNTELAFRHGSRGRHEGRIVDQGHLADDLAAAENRQHPLLISGFAENLHFAGNDQVGHIAGIAFLENQLSADDRFAFPCLIVLVQ